MELFPFAGIGGVAAAAVLVGGYAAFAGLVHLLGAAASGAMSVVPGIATGLRDWAGTDDAAPAAPAPAAAAWEDLPTGTASDDQVGAE
jgi:hypothetical protein